MSTLTYSHDHAAPAEQTQDAPRKSFWRRVYETMIATQQQRAEREVARYLAGHGGLLTDDMEREIMQRLSGAARPRITR